MKAIINESYGSPEAVLHLAEIGMDCGVAALHAELGAMHAGVSGAWERGAEPDLARFVPRVAVTTTPGPDSDQAGAAQRQEAGGR